MKFNKQKKRNSCDSNTGLELLFENPMPCLAIASYRSKLESENTTTIFKFKVKYTLQEENGVTSFELLKKMIIT